MAASCVTLPLASRKNSVNSGHLLNASLNLGLCQVLTGGRGVRERVKQKLEAGVSEMTETPSDLHGCSVQREVRPKERTLAPVCGWGPSDTVCLPVVSSTAWEGCPNTIQFPPLFPLLGFLGSSVPPSPIWIFCLHTSSPCTPASFTRPLSTLVKTAWGSQRKFLEEVTTRRRRDRFWLL